MTSGNVTDLASSFVQMAKAYEELPQVRAELEKAHDDIETYAKSLQAREMLLIERKAEIETHLATIRKVEAERDDAEIRFLELDEKASKVRSKLVAAQSMLMVGEELLTPPKPAPEPVPLEPAPLSYEAPPVTPAYIEPVPPVVPTGQDVPSWAGPEVPKSDENPTVTQASDTSQSVTSDLAKEPEPVSVDPSPAVGSALSEPVGPYYGKRYIDVPGYIHINDWIAGGGTEADYHM